MRFIDSVKVVKQALDGEGQSFELTGVCVTETDAITTEKGGYRNAGEIVLRVPGKTMPDIECGDFVYRTGSEKRYVVCSVRDNRKQGSSISHWKFICRG